MPSDDSPSRLGFTTSDREQQQQQQQQQTYTQFGSTNTAAIVAPSVSDMLNVVFSPTKDRPQATYIGGDDPFERSRRIHRLQINGLSFVRQGFMQDLLKPALQAETLGSIVAQVQQVAGKLQALEVAKSVSVSIDKSKEIEGFVDVVLDCVETKMVKLTTGTELSNDEANVNMTFLARRFLGGGETIAFNGLLGTRTNTVQSILSMPLKADPLRRFEVMLYKNNVDNSYYNSHMLGTAGLQLSYKTYSGSNCLHKFAYDANVRVVQDLSSLASYSVRNEAGYSLKSSVSHSFTRDTRDHPTVPTAGTLLKNTAELAGLGGDVYYLKCDAEIQAAQTVVKNALILTTTLQGGALLPLNGDRTRITDRFFLGGANSLRGFHYAGIGPRDQRDSIGGNMFYAAGVHALFPLTGIFGTRKLLGHLWVNLGSLSLLPTARDDDDADSGKSGKGALTLPSMAHVRHMLNTPSVAAGVGLVYQHSFLRVELNYAVPIAITSTDAIKPGLQLGLGLNFL
ncbi:hypothetical protein EV182_000400 [Spiromyces aspiralis]|uniref:Uncharacterized protein n=1 Tax=Spiromyces aspiralis TaxID=68401 RepID=A0ACC1I283_9FUNG|nr:hypothetical protein EV182_000400 [Spiromyces aspiralis]